VPLVRLDDPLDELVPHDVLVPELDEADRVELAQDLAYVDQPRRQIGGVDLTPRQYDDYTRVSGRLAKTMLDGIISPQFRSMPPGAQIDTIKSIVNQARSMARAELQIGSLGTEDDIVEKGLELRLRVLETGH